MPVKKKKTSKQKKSSASAGSKKTGKKKLLKPAKAASSKPEKDKKKLPAAPSSKKAEKESRRKSSSDPRDLARKEIEDILSHEAALEAPMERRKRRRDTEDEGDDNHAIQSLESEQTLDRTPMKIYLTQIEHIPLLTPQQELDLGAKVQAQNETSEEARHQMIRSNLRLVISIAKRYSNMGLAFSDLVEEGNIGLMRAVEKYNPERGYRFSTYASWWIKQAIMRALSNQGKTIRIPVYMYDVISKWRRVRDGLMQKLNRVPTRKEIAKIMEVPVQKIKEIENIAGRPSSLNAPISLDGSAELIDLIQDESSHGPEAQIGEALKNERLGKLLESLDERERRILTLRFGLGNEEARTLEEAAQEFNITRERVRQIEAAALKKIKALLILENDKLENYLSQ